MQAKLIAILSALLLAPLSVIAGSDDDYGAHVVFPNYQAPKTVIEFYFDHPQKLGAALYWLQGLYKTMDKAPYDMPPDDLKTVVVMHGNEIAALAKKNYAQYSDQVERMRYYAELGVEFKVCKISADQFGYKVEDFPDFIDLVPAAITELVHWQQQGYALIIPHIMERNFTLDEIR